VITVKGAKPGSSEVQQVLDVARKTAKASEQGIKVGVIGAERAKDLLSGTKKVLGPVGTAIGVLALSEKVAHAASSKEPAATDTATRMEQIFEKATDYTDVLVTAAALAPGSPGRVASAAVAQKEIAIAGIQATGGDKRIVEAATSVESLSKRAGFSDVNAETAGAVAAGTMSMGEGVGVITLVTMGPIGWGILGIKAATKR
jgi:hypothetical protein